MAAEQSENLETVRELFYFAIKKFVDDFAADVFDLEYISIRENSSIIISRKNHAYYPPDFISEFQKSSQGLSNAGEYCELNVTLKPLRIVISMETFKASLQLHQRELTSIPNSFWFNENGNLWQLSEDLLEMLEKVKEVDDGNYQICCGLTKDELGSRIHSPYLNCQNYPFTKYVSIKCEGVFRRFIKNHNDQSSYINLRLPRCKNCKLWLKSSRKQNNREAKYKLEEGPSKILKTDCHSSHAISKLNPKNRKIRIRNILIERKNLCRSLNLLKKKYAKLKLILNEDQSDEHKEMVNLISSKLPNKRSNVKRRASKKDCEAQKKDREAQRKDREAQRKDREGQRKDREARRKDREVQRRDREVQRRDREVQRRDCEAQKKDCEAQKKDCEAQKKDCEAQKKDREVQPETDKMHFVKVKLERVELDANETYDQ